jgi:hypothetical protein
MKKTELKVWASTWATFLLSLAASGFLATTATDYVRTLPGLLQATLAPFLLAAGTWVAGYVKRSRPTNLSDSTIDAVRVWMEKHLPKPKPHI